MKRLAAGVFCLLGIFAADLRGQALASHSHATTHATKKTPDKNDPVKAAVGGAALPPGQMITTEIFSDEAFFDSAKHIGTFTGHVIVNDPRFNVQSDKLTIYLSKTQAKTAMGGAPAPAKTPTTPDGQPPQPDQALEKAVAEGNVGVVRDRPGENGAPPTRSIGRADMAIYTTSDGNVELRGTPRVQSGLNMHVATSPDTVMIISQNGQLETHGPSRTEIRQEPKVSPTPTPVPTTAPKP